jgi:hypothetical protein
VLNVCPPGTRAHLPLGFEGDIEVPLSVFEAPQRGGQDAQRSRQ